MRQLHTQRNDWTEARVDQLKALFANGLSSSQIAGEIGGISRNGVIGKVHRLGLQRPSHPSSGPKRIFRSPSKSAIAIGPTKSRQADGGIVEKIRFGVKARKALADNNTPRFKRAPVKLSAEPAEFLNIPFIDLENDQCRFPRGDGPFLFCGQPVLQDQSYCPGCYGIVHAPPWSRRDNSPAPANYAAPGTAWT